LTELADTLVRDHGLPFVTAHAISKRLVTGREHDPRRRLVDLVADASRDLVGTPIVYSEEALAEILSPRHFVDVRKTLGGPAPEETARAAKVSRHQLDADEAWWSRATDALASAERELAERSAAL
jgi:argininosuccinate lyase